MRRVCVGLGVLAACGPSSPGQESGDESAGETTEVGSSGPAEPTSAGPTPTTVAPTSGEPDPTDPSGSTSTGGEPEPTCPEGQADLTLQWGLERTDGLSTPPQPVATADGRIAFPIYGQDGDKWLGGAQFVSALGEEEALVMAIAPPSSDLRALALAPRAGGEVVVVGTRTDEQGDRGWIGLFGPDGQTSELHDMPLEAADRPVGVVHTDATVVLGIRAATLSLHVGGFAADSGAMGWEFTLSEHLGQSRIASGAGGEIVVARGAWASGDFEGEELRFVRISSAGEVLWERSHTPKEQGDGLLGGLMIRDGEQAVALEQWLAPPRVVALGLRLADGELLWRTEIAGDAPAGPPNAYGAVASASGVQVVVARTDESASLPLVVTAHGVSIAGALGATTTLAVPELFGTPLVPGQGPCGDLLLMHVNKPAWLGSFAL